MDTKRQSASEEGHESNLEVVASVAEAVTPTKDSFNETQFFQYEEDDFACFPRCEYRARFNGSSAFNMTTPDVWNTYFRSTPALYNTDRVYSVIQSKYYIRGRLRDRFPEVKAGTFLSPFSNAVYRRMFSNNSAKNRKPNAKQNDFSFYIYDDMLQYKLSICELVMAEYREKIQYRQQHQKLYFENIYPCILVQVMPIENASLKSDAEYSSFYEIIFTYFTAITNAIAFRKGIPTEMIARASFCFSTPCVSKAVHSFRISVGNVSKVYAKKVLVESLLEFNDTFPRFLHSKLGHTFELDAINESIQLYNKRAEEKLIETENNVNKKQIERSTAPERVDTWNQEDTIFNLLCKTGDSIGKTVLCRVTARRKFIELLGNYVHDELIENGKNADLVAPFKRLLVQLEFNEDVIVNVRNENEYIMKKFSFKETDNDIQYDDAYWELMSKISTIFEQNGIPFLCDAVKSRKMLGIYGLIERSNTEFIRNSSDQNACDDCESDSDCEFTADCDTERIYGYCKKIILATGMRAVSIAHFITVYWAGVKRINTEFMYYETEDSLQFINNIVPMLNLDHAGTYQESATYIDINYCNANGKTVQLNLEIELDKMLRNGETEIVILDYTTATTDRINESIKLFIPHVKVILLINSGLKNEQIGADVNTHATLRIITKDANQLNRLYYGLKTILNGQENLPKQVHDIRRAYKSVGAVVTNEKIFKKNGFHFKEGNQDDGDHIRCFKFDETFTRIFQLFFTGKYENELCNIIEKYKKDANDVVSWDFEKITVLGSDEVQLLVNEGVDFEEIRTCYEKDPNLTETMCNNVNRKNVAVFNHMSFVDVFNKYRNSDNGNNIDHGYVREFYRDGCSPKVFASMKTIDELFLNDADYPDDESNNSDDDSTI